MIRFVKNFSICLGSFLFLVFAFDARAQSMPSQVQNYDIRFYTPKENVRDLAFEVRYEGLKEMVEDRLGVENLIDVYFQVYWLSPGRFKINVAGLPDGFEELRAQLKNMVRARLDLVIPETLASRLRGYQTSTNSIKSGVQVVAKDPTHSKVINEIFLNFDNSGKLTRMRTQSPMGTNTTNLEMSAKSWSNNKWVLDEVEMSSVQGVQMTTVNQKISYLTESGVGLPKKVEITTTYQANTTDEESEGVTTEEAVITFSNYRVNSGAAKEMIISD